MEHHEPRWQLPRTSCVHYRYRYRCCHHDVGRVQTTGVEEARLADLFQLSRTDWGRRMLAEGRGAATAPLAQAHSKQAAKPPARPPKSTSSSARPPATLSPGYASSRLPQSGRIEETGGRDVRDFHPYPPVTTPAPPPPRPRSTTSDPALLQGVAMRMLQSYAK